MFVLCLGKGLAGVSLQLATSPRRNPSIQSMELLRQVLLDKRWALVLFWAGFVWSAAHAPKRQHFQANFSAVKQVPAILRNGNVSVELLRSCE